MFKQSLYFLPSAPLLIFVVALVLRERRFALPFSGQKDVKNIFASYLLLFVGG
jgi:hypothetical protein